MQISLYTLPNCEASKLTREAFLRAGIQFSERSAADQSPLEAPVVSTIVDRRIVAWRGHRADMIELLHALVSEGPVPAHGLSDLEEARHAVLTRHQALVQVEEHGAWPQSFLDECGDHALYRGSVVLDWLGY
ncbi:hypothetical protein [Bordetella genomosp. 5]|uniref:Arsenate reductase n=1 Tax=Bordetella genomosp. 5 TaxID=1395608 RepID=A0A261TBE7_9BORD|nr:hypothetical protein [Bordetella genomosp. 5]OZI46956.1 hypothetical protein CAL25_20060 [Bordetella genomosp. 5]